MANKNPIFVGALEAPTLLIEGVTSIHVIAFDCIYFLKLSPISTS